MGGKAFNSRRVETKELVSTSLSIRTILDSKNIYSKVVPFYNNKLDHGDILIPKEYKNEAIQMFKDYENKHNGDV